MEKKIVALVIVVFGTVLVFGGWWFTQSGDDETTTAQPSQQEQDGITEPEIVATFTTAEIAEHSTQADCWTIIGGGVYDITNYIPIHPGGAEILRACGTDGTTLFDSRTTDEGETVGSGTPHSSNAISQLGQFYLGDLEI